MIDNNNNKAGDLVFRAGDGSENGNGGDLNIGPGTYKAGDFVQKIEKKKSWVSELVEPLVKIFKD